MAHPNAVPPPPEVMFKMITGYWVSQTVGALARLGVCDLLVDGPRGADALASEVGADPSALFRVMRAAASVGVVQHHDDDRVLADPNRRNPALKRAGLHARHGDRPDCGGPLGRRGGVHRRRQNG